MQTRTYGALKSWHSSFGACPRNWECIEWIPKSSRIRIKTYQNLSKLYSHLQQCLVVFKSHLAKEINQAIQNLAVSIPPLSKSKSFGRCTKYCRSNFSLRLSWCVKALILKRTNRTVVLLGDYLYGFAKKYKNSMYKWWLIKKKTVKFIHSFIVSCHEISMVKSKSIQWFSWEKMGPIQWKGLKQITLRMTRGTLKTIVVRLRGVFNLINLDRLFRPDQGVFVVDCKILH